MKKTLLFILCFSLLTPPLSAASFSQYSPTWSAPKGRFSSARKSSKSFFQRFFNTKPYWERKVDEVLDTYDQLWGLGTMGKFAEGKYDCAINIVQERLIQEYGQTFLSGDYPKATGHLRRLAHYLQCIDSQTAVWLDYAGSEILRAVAKNPAGRTQGIKALMNPFILVSDLVLFRKSYIQWEMQAHRSLFKSAIEGYPVEMGLHCMDFRTGGLTQYTQKNPSSTPARSGKGATPSNENESVQAMPEMVTTLTNEGNRMGMGICGCTDIVEDSEFKCRTTPPCLPGGGGLSDLSKGFFIGAEEEGIGKMSGVKGEMMANGLGISGAEGARAIGSIPSSGSSNPFSSGGSGLPTDSSIPMGAYGDTGFGTGIGEVPLWMTGINEADLQMGPCGSGGTPGSAGDSTGGMSPSGHCPLRVIVAFSKSLQKNPIADLIKCVKGAYDHQRERQFNQAINPSQPTLDSQCTISSPGGLLWEIQKDHFGEKPERGSGQEQQLRGTFGQAAEMIKNDPNAVGFIQEQCPTCTNIEQGINQAVNQAQQDPRVLPPVGSGHPEGGAITAAIDPETGRAVDQRVGLAENRIDNVQNAVHELWHAILNFFGIGTDPENSGTGTAAGQAPPGSQEAKVQQATQQTMNNQPPATGEQPAAGTPESQPAAGGAESQPAAATNPGEGGEDCSGMSEHAKELMVCARQYDEATQPTVGPTPGGTPPDDGPDPTIAFPNPEDAGGSEIAALPCGEGSPPPTTAPKAEPECNFGDAPCQDSQGGGMVERPARAGGDPNPNDDSTFAICPAGTQLWYNFSTRQWECRPEAAPGGAPGGPGGGGDPE